MKSIVYTLITAAMVSPAAAQPVFDAPLPITTDAGNYQFARNPNGVAQVSKNGVLHVVYWEGGEATTASTPSAVYYRSMEVSGDWSREERLDNGSPGGRHPVVAVRHDDDYVFVAWHDHRHSTEAGGYQDNVEIYGKIKPPTGSFDAADLRLTHSTSGSVGDNSYLPRIVINPLNGNCVVAWYDYAANASVADLYLREVDFLNPGLPPAMHTMQLTDATTRGGTPSFTVPDLAFTSTGSLRLAWTTGNFSGGDLYTGVATTSGTIALVQQIGTGAGDALNDPPRVVTVEGSDWIIYADESAGAGSERIKLREFAAGAGASSGPYNLTPTFAGRQTMPAVIADERSRLYFAWIDERAGTHVYYGVWDRDSRALIEEVQVTQNPGDYSRPVLVMDTAGQPVVLYENRTSVSESSLWCARVLAITSADRWSSYE